MTTQQKSDEWKEKQKKMLAWNRLWLNYEYGQSVWTFVNGLRIPHKAINMGQGFPDESIDCPIFLKKAAQHAVFNQFNQYTATTGQGNLVNELIRIYNNKFNGQISLASNNEPGKIRDKIQLTPENIQITNGCCGGCNAIFEALLNPGDEVITLEPYFDFYKFQIAQAQGVHKTVPLRLSANQQRWTFDPMSLKKVLNSKTKMLLLNTPHNPTGYVMSWKEMQQIASILKDFPDVIIACDEVYEYLVYDNNKHYHFAAVNSDVYARTLTLSSAAKTFSATGWKIGVCIQKQVRQTHDVPVFVLI
ncbi:kynurenine aminotransferase [Reticulomyxa filosa]|uniref:Kynurenine aminotransferase n=1 Tax=Reticulomyxa filosa TaxID=46433 RepID=X6MGK7_RETFI|nr:kynurenine aminotransferase [Reticulomyxa filosa]|eukprot:ETO12185.1 kynurenine aminotransferase [Reticulomyxa filosa]